MNNNTILKNSVTSMLIEYIQSKPPKKKSKNKVIKNYIFLYGSYRFECNFYINKIDIHIYSLKNKFNKIHFTPLKI